MKEMTQGEVRNLIDAAVQNKTFNPWKPFEELRRTHAESNTEETSSEHRPTERADS